MSHWHLIASDFPHMGGWQDPPFLLFYYHQLKEITLTTSTPNTPNELVELNQQEDWTPEKVRDIITDELTYEQEDNLIYHLLQRQLNFHQFLLEKSLKGESKGNPIELVKSITRLETICDLYKEV